MSLNAPQRDAVRTLSGPLLVLAGAGTGKTRVITHRIARLIEHGAKPGRILAVTFTNKAAREMKQRALGLLGKRRRGAETPEISTFHSLCVRILRRHATRLGYPAEFTIYDRGDQESVARAALRDMIKLLGEKKGLSREDAYMLCSLAADLRVTQLVNGHNGVHVMLEKRYLE